MGKNIIRLTENSLRTLVKEAVSIILEGTKIENLNGSLHVMEDTLAKIKKEDSKIRAQITKLKKTFSWYENEPEFLEEVKAKIAEYEKKRQPYIQQMNDLNIKIAEIKKEIKAIQDAHASRGKILRQKGKEVRDALKPEPVENPNKLTPDEAKALGVKRTKSRNELDQMAQNEKMEKIFNQILTTGEYWIYKGRTARINPNAKQKEGMMPNFVDNDSYILHEFKEYMAQNHPEYTVKKSYKQAKRKRGQLDDTVYYDIRVTLEKNPEQPQVQPQEQPQTQPQAEKPRTIRFDNPNTIKFSKDDVPDYTY